MWTNIHTLWDNHWPTGGKLDDGQIYLGIELNPQLMNTIQMEIEESILGHHANLICLSHHLSWHHRDDVLLNKNDQPSWPMFLCIVNAFGFYRRLIGLYQDQWRTKEILWVFLILHSWLYTFRSFIAEAPLLNSLKNKASRIASLIWVDFFLCW